MGGLAGRAVGAWAMVAMAGAVSAATFEGAIQEVDGVDDATLSIKLGDGKSVGGYCLNLCDQFVDFLPDNFDHPFRLKPGMRGRAVRVEIVTVPNRGRVAGPGKNDPVTVMKRIQLLK